MPSYVIVGASRGLGVGTTLSTAHIYIDGLNFV